MKGIGANLGSWPDLFWPSTLLAVSGKTDARHTAGHDESSLRSLALEPA